MGALCSFVLLVITISYTILKVDVLFKKKDVDIFTAVNELYLSDDWTFSARQGLNIAVGLGYNGIDPTIASINFYRVDWDVLNSQATKLQSHECTQEELGASGSNSRFFPIRSSQAQYLDIIKPGAFQCIDDSDLQIQGNFNSLKGSIL